MFLENADWLWPSLTLKLVFTLIIVGVATRGKAQTLNMPAAKEMELTNPLPIGEPISDELWNVLITLWNAEDDRTETITLGDYRGKVIVLDFWATWCKSCIVNMPRMHRLQDKFESDVVVLPVTYEDETVVSAFLERTADKGMVALRPLFKSIIADSVLKRVFPNPDRSIPYFAIIGNNGEFVGLTIPPQMNEQLLASLVSGEEAYIPPLQAAPETPLLERSPRYIANRLNKPVYYSMLSGYMEGFTFPASRTVDTISQIRRDYYINMPLLRLYSNALSSGLPNQPNRRIFLVDSVAQYEYHYRRNSKFDYREQCFCFEGIFPIDVTKEEANAHLLLSLNTLTGVHGSLITRPMPCFVIRVDSSITQSITKSSAHLRQLTMRSFVDLLNRQYDTAIPPVIDESGYTGKLWIDEEFDFGDIEQVRKVLARYNMLLDSESRELEMFVLSDGEHDPVSTPITLSKYGYVRKGVSNE